MTTQEHTALTKQMEQRPSPTASGWALTPRSLDEAMRFCEILADSQIIPEIYRGKPGNIFVAAQKGASLGVGPIEAMENIAVINGKACVWGDLMLAVVMAHPACDDVIETFDPQAYEWTCVAKRRGKTPVSRTFTLKEAQEAGYTKKQGAWQTNPKRMVQMRARAFALRDRFPDVLKGIAMVEEVRDYPDTIPETVPIEPAMPMTPATQSQPMTIDADIVDSTPVTIRVDDVIDAITAATTLDELSEAGRLARALPAGSDDRQRAIDAGKRRKADLSAAAAAEMPIDAKPATGEPSGSEILAMAMEHHNRLVDAGLDPTEWPSVCKAAFGRSKPTSLDDIAQIAVYADKWISDRGR